MAESCKNTTEGIVTKLAPMGISVLENSTGDVFRTKRFSRISEGFLLKAKDIAKELYTRSSWN